ncbi:hypothetical protein R6Q59_001686, partial [Mikania micrantha]
MSVMKLDIPLTLRKENAVQRFPAWIDKEIKVNIVGESEKWVTNRDRDKDFSQPPLPSSTTTTTVAFVHHCDHRDHCRLRPPPRPPHLRIRIPSSEETLEPRWWYSAISKPRPPVMRWWYSSTTVMVTVAVVIRRPEPSSTTVMVTAVGLGWVNSHRDAYTQIFDISLNWMNLKALSKTIPIFGIEFKNTEYFRRIRTKSIDTQYRSYCKCKLLTLTYKTVSDAVNVKQMTYAGLQMFMEKLKQLINCNDNPLTNHPEIIREKPQFQLLYQDLGSIIQILYIGEHQNPHELEKFDDLTKSFIDVAEEAEYIVDLFLSAVHTRYKGNLSPASEEDIKPSLNLDDVRSSLQSVKMDFMSMGINNMELSSSQRPVRMLNQSAATVPGYSSGLKKIPDGMIIVGIDDDAKLIKDKLMEDRKKLDVVSVVGMGGIGKTTLATKVFNDAYVKYHFHVRVWVTVSQTYDKRHVLTQILESIRGQLDLGVASDSQLRELVHKQLMGKRYLIVIDDIWHIETWDNLKLFFPHGNNGSRILLTSRLTEVAKHATSDGLIHHLRYLNIEKGWELLCKKVFHGNECPEWSIKPGMQIVENCKGLPLALAVIAGVLAKDSLSEKFWVEIAYRTGSYIVDDQNGSILETLALSYNHLPLHLRECLLYLGGFPEDYEFKVQWLIWLWMAEGFIQQAGNQSLEDIAEAYLMDLIDRNLVNVEVRSNSNGGVKTCKVHDLVRELCLRKAKEEGFIVKTEPQTSSSHFSNVTTMSYKPVRMFIHKNPNIVRFSYPSAENLRSILCFNAFTSLSDDMVLKLHFGAFVGSCWNMDVNHGFARLTFLRLEWLDIELWTAEITSFSCLKQLEIKTCIYLEEIPAEIGEIPTLELIKIKSCRQSVGESVRRIQKEQHDFGNYDLQIVKIPDDIIIVGIDDDAKLIKDKLMEDRKKLDVVSVVGMGGIGKTTLATKVFNDAYVKYRFHVRVWVTVSQTYDKRHVLIQILESIHSQLDLGVASDSQLRELVHKQLMGKRYLIVIDDIWHIETWDDLKLFFPHNNNGSRILLTSRLTEVAKHATSDGLIHHLGYLNKEKGWELLCKKVFHGNECPEWSIKPGMQIVENCKGLPLAVAVIAGVLAKESWSEKFWVEIAYRTGSYIVGDHNGSIMETLALSYIHLPLHLRECFLYLGGFPEDFMFKVRWLILLWVAEGFIHEDGNRSSEDIAEGYLMDLIDRNLVNARYMSNSNGGVKACKVHDLVRELCLRKANEKGFIIKTKTQTSSHSSNVTTTSYKPVHMFIDKDPNILRFSYPSVRNLR